MKRFPDRVYEERRVTPDCGIFENRSGQMKKMERFFGLFEIMSTFAPNSCCIRLTVRTVDSQSTNKGSIPLYSTKFLLPFFDNIFSRLFCVKFCFRVFFLFLLLYLYNYTI